MTPRPTPADYAEADLCMAELAKRADADWHRRRHDDNRDGFAFAAMQRRQHAEWLQARALATNQKSQQGKPSLDCPTEAAGAANLLTTGLVPGEPERPLSSGGLRTAGADHAPAPASRDGSGTARALNEAPAQRVAANVSSSRKAA